MSPAGDTILEVRDLKTFFPTRAGIVRAVDGVSFALKRGTTLCVVGESGSGKSVTARSILQIVDRPGRIESGSIPWRAATARRPTLPSSTRGAGKSAACAARRSP